MNKSTSFKQPAILSRFICLFGPAEPKGRSNQMTSTQNPGQRERSGPLASIALLLVMFLLGVVGLGIFRWKEKAVFPNASIDLRIPKSEILRQAEEWTKKLGYQKERIVKSITFGYDDDAKTFLEYELGNSTANKLMSETVPIFYWNCRFRQEFDQEKFDVQLSPTGKLTAFEFDLPNDKALPSLSHSEAKKKALAFVQEHTQWKEADLKLVEDETVTCPHRVDHSFTWEYQPLDWKGAKLRAKADLSGNLLSSYDLSLHQPEEWDRKYSTVRSNNELLYSIAQIFYVLIYLASVFIFFDSLPRRNVRWKFTLGLAAFCALLYAADQFNSLPDLLSEYSPQSSYSAFVTQVILSILGQVPFVFAISMILGGTAEILYRTTFADKIALEKLFTVKSLSSWQTIEGILGGTFAFGICLGYQIGYYWLGEHINYWCPLSLDNYQLLTSTIPSLNAFSFGFFASGSEEVLYRIIMLVLVQRLVGNFWLANILQAAAWGFMHSNYPQQPAYARGVELTIEGIFNGWMLQRFGLLACFVSHYLFDAWCMVLPLWSAPALYHKISASIPLVPVLFVALFGIVLRKKDGVPAEEPLLNQAIPTPDTSHLRTHTKREVQPLEYKPIKATWRYALLAISLVAPVIIHFVKPTTQIYTHPQKLQSSRDQVIETARKHLTDLHFNMIGYRVATTISNGLAPGNLEMQYIYEKAGFAKANLLAEEVEHSYKWSVRFFKPLVQEEYQVLLDQNGKVISQTITKPEDAAGAKLTEGQARKIAEDYLKEYRSLYAPLEFDDVKVENRKNRIDYNFTYKVPKYKVADADFIVTQEVIGDIPSAVSHYWKIPDQWRWERQKQTKKDEICRPIIIGLAAVLLIATIWWVVSLFRSHFVRWRIPFLVGIGASLMLCLQTINYLPGYFNMYRTSMPLQTYIVVSLVASIIGLALLLAFITFGIAVAWGGLHSDSHKSQIESTLSLLWPFGAENTFKTRRDLWIDAFLLAGVFAAFVQTMSIAGTVAKFHFGHYVQTNTDYQFLNGLAISLWPCLNIVTSALQSTVLMPLGFAAAVGIATKYRITKFWHFLSVYLLIIAISSSTERYWQDYLLGLTLNLVGGIGYWFLITKAINRNILCIFVLIWINSLWPAVRNIYKYGLSLFPLELAVAAALLLMPLTYLLYLQWRVMKQRAATKLS